MAVRVFSDEDLERLRSVPEINREELIRFFTVTQAARPSQPANHPALCRSV